MCRCPRDHPMREITTEPLTHFLLLRYEREGVPDASEPHTHVKHLVPVSLHDFTLTLNFGCILLGLFRLFLFRFRNNRIHGNFNFEKNAPTCFRSGNGIGGDLRTTISAHATGAGGRVGFPAKNFPKERVFCLFRVNRILSILFILLSGAE